MHRVKQCGLDVLISSLVTTSGDMDADLSFMHSSIVNLCVNYRLSALDGLVYFTTNRYLNVASNQIGNGTLRLLARNRERNRTKTKEHDFDDD